MLITDNRYCKIADNWYLQKGADMPINRYNIGPSLVHTMMIPVLHMFDQLVKHSGTSAFHFGTITVQCPYQKISHTRHFCFLRSLMLLLQSILTTAREKLLGKSYNIIWLHFCMFMQCSLVYIKLLTDFAVQYNGQGMDHVMFWIRYLLR